MTVMAKIRCDENVVWRRRRRSQIRVQRPKVDDMLRAGGRVDDGVKINERVMPGGILIAGLSTLGVIGRADGRVSAAGAFPPGIVSHVLHVRLPAQTFGFELIGDRRYACRVDASGTHDLTVGCDAGRHKFGKLLAVVLSRRIRRLAADQCNVIAKTEVTGAEIIGQQRALAC